ncbi:MAG: hypothetical protein AAGI68_10665 [Planctomycetota bacterium]
MTSLLAPLAGELRSPGLLLALGEPKDFVLVAGLLLIILAGFMLLRKRHAKGPDTTAREHIHRLKEEHGVRGDLESLMVDIEQLAKRLSSQLDAKVTEVEKVLAEADQRIAQLQSNSPPAPAAAEAHPQPASPTPAKQNATAPPLPVDPLTQAVYDLADAGQEPADIAQQTGEHLGKVELILALRRAEQREQAQS